MDNEEQQEEHDCEEEDLIYADTVMESDQSPLSSVTITCAEDEDSITSLPRRATKRQIPSNSNLVISSTTSLAGAGTIYPTSALPTLTSTHLIVPNGYSVPRTINQTTITPTIPILPKSNNVVVTNGNGNHSSNGGSGSGSSSSGGPNYFFGQYIASVLDSLPQSESLLARHKLQEIIYDAQTRLSQPQRQLIDFKCVNCCKIYQGEAQLP